MDNSSNSPRTPFEQATTGPIDQYRPMAALAMISAVLVLPAFLAFSNWVFLPIAAVSVVTGWLALRKIKAEPDDWAGKRLAIAGITASAAVLVAAVAFHGSVWINAHMKVRWKARQFADALHDADLDRTYLAMVPEGSQDPYYVEPTEEDSSGMVPRAKKEFLDRMRGVLQSLGRMDQPQYLGTTSLVKQHNEFVARVNYQLKSPRGSGLLGLMVVGIPRSEGWSRVWHVKMFRVDNQDFQAPEHVEDVSPTPMIEPPNPGDQ